ncbi:MAG: protease inhibitor I42 family protein [Senegalia sp. (in: firmicutes)]|uniref:protease inhibitor I42 family protein n=1 Tax=Senegalia sp. (in: firmicutes) TaxID=1924098 RepID=UPI003F9B885C
MSNNEKLNLYIPLDSNFIISLPANRTIYYTWNTKNEINKKIISIKGRLWIDIPIPKSDRDKEGTNYDRQNFHFKSLRPENQKIIMKYENKSKQNNDFFEIEFNINIE